ncbi:hypothetical protein [Tenacibaculum soleae]|uniref:hypothetical protein n=1 Tax=Tenacibaculum soleae TaxID=447689 RepID=UPI0023001537|nr:hypothetical protein [Tenacibaculum soleae]
MEVRKCTNCKHKYSENNARIVAEEDENVECCPECLNPEYTLLPKGVKVKKQKKIKYTDKQIAVFKTKADRWDKLEEEIASHYINSRTNEPWTDEELEDKGYDLTSIGEAAASAFNWLH